MKPDSGYWSGLVRRSSAWNRCWSTGRWGVLLRVDVLKTGIVTRHRWVRMMARAVRHNYLEICSCDKSFTRWGAKVDGWFAGIHWGSSFLYFSNFVITAILVSRICSWIGLLTIVSVCGIRSLCHALGPDRHCHETHHNDHLSSVARIGRTLFRSTDKKSRNRTWSICRL